MKRWLIYLLLLVCSFARANYNGNMDAVVTASRQISATEIRQEGLFQVNGHWKYGYWTDRFIGSGSGSWSINAGSTYVPGDRFLVNPGVYSGGSVSSVNNITVLPSTYASGGRLTMTGTITLSNTNHVTLQYLTFSGVAGDCFDATGGSNTQQYLTLKNIAFYSCHGLGIDITGNQAYIKNNDATYKLQYFTVDSVYKYDCGPFWSNFAEIGQGDPKDVVDSAKLTRFTVLATSLTGEEHTEVRGIFNRFEAAYWVITSVTQRGASGDVGVFYGKGASGHIHHIMRWGGPGHIARFTTFTEFGKERDFIYHDCYKANTTCYAQVNAQGSAAGYTNTTAGTFRPCSQVYVYNNTSVNQKNPISYTAGIFTIGENNQESGYRIHAHAKNNAGFNLETSGSYGKIVSNLGGTTQIASDLDSSNNYYSATPEAFDSTSHTIANVLGTFRMYYPKSVSPLRGGGVTNPFSTTDVTGHPYNSPPDIGAFQYYSGGGNLAPTANISPAGTTTINLPVSSFGLNGTGSSDPDGTVVAWAWSQVSGPTSTLSSTTASSITVSNINTAGTYVYQLIVTDNSGAQSSAVQKTLIVQNSPNQPPVANFTAASPIQLPITPTYTSTSTDPDGTITAWAWSKVSGPTGGTFTTPTNSSSTVTGLQVGTYVFQLTVTDNGGAQSSVQRTVVVRAANQPPVASFTATPQTFVYPGTSVSALNADASTDPDGSIASYAYSLASGPTGSSFSAATSSHSNFTVTQIGSYVLQLTVNDNQGLTNGYQLTVTVTNTPPVNGQIIIFKRHGRHIFGN